MIEKDFEKTASVGTTRRIASKDGDSVYLSGIFTRAEIQNLLEDQAKVMIELAALNTNED